VFSSQNTTDIQEAAKMMTDAKKRPFDKIHYIDDDDADWIIRSILKEKTILKFINFFDLQLNTRHYIDILTTLRTVTELQSEILVPVFNQIFDNTADEVTCSNIEAVSRDKAGIFISNHRDIVLDSAAMNLMLHQNGFRFANAGIGDNLLMNDAVQIIFNMMKCFVIKRGLPGKQQVYFLRDLSEFINYCITEKEESIWIAQSGGRAKNGDDRTNPAVVKMLAMSNREDAVSHLGTLNLHTTACSYEWDPCDVFKVEELLVREQGQTYKKKPNEDMLSIHAGICEPKGRIHVTFNRLSTESIESCRDLNEQKRCATLAGMIDTLILNDYRLWPSNYIAADLLRGAEISADNYTCDEKEFFIERMERRLCAKIKDRDALPGARRIFLTMYANPVFNKNLN
jgi:hypothetical protein